MQLKKKYTFHEGDFPAQSRADFGVAIFNRAAYGDLQSPSGWFSFYILRDTEVCACIRFCIVDGIAKSPLRAPFGSLDLRPGIDAQVVFEFLSYCEDKLRSFGVSGVALKNPPDLYDPERMALLTNFFLTHDYRITDAEVSAIISVSVDPFRERIHRRKKRKLEQSRCDALRFVKLEGSALKQVYEFIAGCRKRKDYRLSITLMELTRFVNRFPNDYLLFGVFYDDKIVAASVTIRVHNRALYHFISDHVHEIGALRPGLILMEGIYNYCFSDGISILDLGTSTLDGKPDVKLLRFKTEIGGRLTHKFSFQKNF